MERLESYQLNGRVFQEMKEQKRSLKLQIVKAKIVGVSCAFRGSLCFEILRRFIGGRL